VIDQVGHNSPTKLAAAPGYRNSCHTPTLPPRSRLVPSPTLLVRCASTRAGSGPR
jgi:hypothetical protein